MLALVVCAGTSSCGGTPHDSKPSPVIRISTNIRDILDAYAGLPGWSIEPVLIGTSAKRLEALQSGTIDVAVTTADLTYEAFVGQLAGNPHPFDKLRGIALLHRVVVHLIVGPEISLARGFRGLRVVLGSPTRGSSAIGERLINSTGVASSEVRGEFLPDDVAVTRLLRREVDAAVVTGLLPQSAVTRALSGGARLLDIDGPQVDRLWTDYPLLKRTLIPGGTYPGQQRSIRTVGLNILLICRADLDDALVYRLTRAYFEEFPDQVRPRADLESAPATVIPLHPGAARYYRERELAR